VAGMTGCLRRDAASVMTDRVASGRPVLLVTVLVGLAALWIVRRCWRRGPGTGSGRGTPRR
jgi:hypothetical protein